MGACAFYQNQTNCGYKHSVASEIAGFFEDQCLFFNVSILKKKKAEPNFHSTRMRRSLRERRTEPGKMKWRTERKESLCPRLAHWLEASFFQAALPPTPSAAHKPLTTVISWGPLCLSYLMRSDQLLWFRQFVKGPGREPKRQLPNCLQSAVDIWEALYLGFNPVLGQPLDSPCLILT